MVDFGHIVRTALVYKVAYSFSAFIPKAVLCYLDGMITYSGGPRGTRGNAGMRGKEANATLCLEEKLIILGTGPARGPGRGEFVYIHAYIGT